MRVRAVGHACLEIEARHRNILCDPWWEGPAYTGQWHPWPTPRPGGLTERSIDYLYLSHGHEDHLHLPTLKKLRVGSVLVPELLAGGMGDFLRSTLDTSHVIEMPHGKTLTLPGGLRATCYANLSDSMLVLEDGDQVVVNANDALHASPPSVIEHFCKLLLRNHPPVTQLYLGYGGASWFPNCIRLPQKDDREVAKARERLFVSNFLRIVDTLRPKVAAAFAASFVLLDPQVRWITEERLSLSAPDQVFATRPRLGSTRCHLLLPGDVIDGTSIQPGGAERPTLETFSAALGGELAEARQRAETLAPISDAKLRELAMKVDERIASSRHRLGRDAAFCIDLYLRERPDRAIRVEVAPGFAKADLSYGFGAPIRLDLRREILEAAIDEDYGIESIVIGYGAIASLQRPEQLPHVQALLGLLSPRVGSWRAVVRELEQRPLRALEGIWRQRWPLLLATATRLGLLPHPYDLSKLGAERQRAA